MARQEAQREFAALLWAAEVRELLLCQAMYRQVQSFWGVAAEL